MRSAALILSLVLWAGSPAPAGSSAFDDLKPGLIGEYFGLSEGIEDFPTIAADRKATVRKLDKELNWEAVEGKFNNTDLEDHFYARWTGIVRVPKDGTYTIYTESDDGSRLWVGGKLVVDNGGLHAMEEKNGKIELKAGDHEIKVDLFENEGQVGLKVSWETEGVSKQIIPASALFHKADQELDKSKE